MQLSVDVVSAVLSPPDDVPVQAESLHDIDRRGVMFLATLASQRSVAAGELPLLAMPQNAGEGGRGVLVRACG